MNPEEYRFYIAKGRSLEAVRSFQERMREASDQRAALAERVGAKACVTRHCVIGFVFDGDPPEGWNRIGSVGDFESATPYFAPYRRKKADKALHQEMAALRTVGADEFTRHIGRSTVFGPMTGQGFRILHSGYTDFGDAVVIFVPKADEDKTAPPDAEPIPASRYMAMREARDARAAMAAE